MSSTDRWDYIIVGAGSAGCALCYELAKSGSSRVLVLEAGGHDRSAFVKIPAGQIRAIQRHDWGFVSEPDPSRNERTDIWSRGRVLGGSSSVNGMVYVRGASTDFDRWAALGNRGWSYADVLPIFRDMERSDQRNPYRGARGRMHVRTVSRVHALTEAFVNSAIKCGWPFNPDYNGQTQEGVAFAQLSQRGRFRCSAADAFLKPLLHRDNLQLMLHSDVERIQLSNGRATGVTFRRGQHVRTEQARHVILCAGAINSPKLLMLSGIGDAADLARHGIACSIHRPDVGRNLREHPLLKLTYRMRVPSNNLTEGWMQALRIGARYLFYRSGPLINLFEAVAFLRSSPGLDAPDIQLHFLSTGYSQSVDGRIGPLDFPSVTVLVNKSHPHSRGHVRLRSGNPADAPAIECRLLEERADVETLMRGVEIVRALMMMSPIADWVDREIAPARELSEADVRACTEIAYHPIGTCRMGADADAVVTPELRVVGVDNLWVADASVMPDLISGNTNAACMMIGTKLGRYLNGFAALGESPEVRPA